MKSKEELKKYRGMTISELIQELKKVKNDHIKSLLNTRAEKNDNSSSVNKIQKDLARISTIITEKRYGEEDGK